MEVRKVERKDPTDSTSRLQIQDPGPERNTRARRMRNIQAFLSLSQRMPRSTPVTLAVLYTPTTTTQMAT